jgi:hypothetical protein
LFLAQTKNLSQNFRKKVATGEGERERERDSMACRQISYRSKGTRKVSNYQKKKLNISNKQAYHSFKIS